MPWLEAVVQDPGLFVWFIIVSIAGVGGGVVFFAFIKWTFNID